MRTSLALVAFGFVALLSSTVCAQQAQEPLAPCSQEFITDFDAVMTSMLDIVTAIDAEASADDFRATVVAGLNNCELFAKKYVQIDPKNGFWSGKACVRETPKKETLEPKFHRAECEYLQRLLGHETSKP